MQQVSSSTARDNPLWEKILGDKDRFSMENRLFSLICFIAMVVLAIFFVINSLEGYWAICALVVAVFIFEGVFYYFSRFKAVYRVNIIINGILSCVALAANYCINSGINGPTIFLFFFTCHLLITGTPNRLQPYWIAFHLITVSALTGIEFAFPRLIKYGYKSNGERVIDILSCYLVTLVFIFIVTRFLLNYYLREKIKTADSQFKLKAFFETSDSCYVLLNRQFDVIYFNHAAARFIRKMYNKELKEGKKIKQFLNPVSGNRFTELYTAALKGVSSEGEQMVPYEGMGNIWWQFSFAPVLNNKKNITGVAFTCDNITERKEQEEKIKKKNLSLMKIAYVQSHELRQPVSSILGLLNLLKEDPGRSGEYLLYLEGAVAELDTRLHQIMVQTKTAYKDE